LAALLGQITMDVQFNGLLHVCLVVTQSGGQVIQPSLTFGTDPGGEHILSSIYVLRDSMRREAR
jgi:hypothetical protein